MSGGLNRRIASTLESLRQRDRFRQRRVVEPAGPGLARVAGRDCVNFCSNDYLGLAQDSRLLRGLDVPGSAASALVTGYSPAHAELEEALADWLERDRVLLFPTGFSANVGIVDALLQRGDLVACDALNHASLIDGVRLSGADKRIYAHVDVDAARDALAAPCEGVRALVTDAVFSMDGDIAPVRELVIEARRADALLYVDDAHGVGVLGPRGRGVADELSQDELPVLVGTLGKALGTAGAFVAGPAAVIDYLENRARSQIYSTAFAPMTARAALTALAITREEAWRRDEVRNLIAHLHARLRSAGLPVPDSPTAIQPIVLGRDSVALRVSDDLLARGFLVTAIRPPTVPEGAARLRVTLTAAHTTEQVDGLVDALATSLLEARVA